jgi:hypothetical protein
MEQVAASIPNELETSVIAEQKLGKQFLYCWGWSSFVSISDAIKTSTKKKDCDFNAWGCRSNYAYGR